MPQRLGVFGGSFDPIHRGHLALAECCCEAVGLDRVLFVPTAKQPLKPSGPVAANGARLAMLELAIADTPQFEISTLELDRGGVSYMVDTLRELRQSKPHAEFYLMMGADSLSELPRWRGPREICELSTLVVVNRPGEPVPDFTAVEALFADEDSRPRYQVVTMPPQPISSTAIRQQIVEDGNWQPLVPERVAEHIQERGIYQGEP